MSNVPAELKYSKEHEWLRKEADGTYTVGITEHAQELLGDMVTYPSTHGVYEETIREVCEVVHQFGGQVYLDGANMPNKTRQGPLGLAALRAQTSRT